MGYAGPPVEPGCRVPPLKYPKRAFEFREEEEAWAREWDIICMMLKMSGRDLSKIPITCIDAPREVRFRSPFSLNEMEDNKE